MAYENDKFNSINELYKRILPALKTKTSELKRNNLNISEEDIWRFCLHNKWRKKSDLRIHEIVDDILNVDVFQLEIFTKKNDNKVI